MHKKYEELIEKLKLDHQKYRELINRSHMIVEKILEVDEQLDAVYDEADYDEDLEQAHWERRDHLMHHLDENWSELEKIGVQMTKQDFFDLIDYQNVR
tara:strand:- start:65 stop:358 length:294 start_codon:yes stop_codon:yes gene_type:complete